MSSATSPPPPLLAVASPRAAALRSSSPKLDRSMSLDGAATAAVLATVRENTTPESVGRLSDEVQSVLLHCAHELMSLSQEAATNNHSVARRTRSAAVRPRPAAIRQLSVAMPPPTPVHNPLIAKRSAAAAMTSPSRSAASGRFHAYKWECGAEENVVRRGAAAPPLPKAAPPSATAAIHIQTNVAAAPNASGSDAIPTDTSTLSSTASSTSSSDWTVASRSAPSTDSTTSSSGVGSASVVLQRRERCGITMGVASIVAGGGSELSSPRSVFSDSPRSLRRKRDFGLPAIPSPGDSPIIADRPPPQWRIAASQPSDDEDDSESVAKSPSRLTHPGLVRSMLSAGSRSPPSAHSTTSRSTSSSLFSSATASTSANGTMSADGYLWHVCGLSSSAYSDILDCFDAMDNNGDRKGDFGAFDFEYSGENGRRVVLSVRDLIGENYPRSFDRLIRSLRAEVREESRHFAITQLAFLLNEPAASIHSAAATIAGDADSDGDPNNNGNFTETSDRSPDADSASNSVSPTPPVPIAAPTRPNPGPLRRRLSSVFAKKLRGTFSVREKSSPSLKIIAHSAQSVDPTFGGSRDAAWGQSPSRCQRASLLHSPLPLSIHYLMAMALYEGETSRLEGLFRVSGSVSEVDQFTAIAQRLGPNDPLPGQMCAAERIKSVAGVAKRFLRAIPGKLVSKRLSLMMKLCLDCEHQSQRIRGFQCCALFMDSARRDALLEWCSFLLEFSKFSHNHKLNVHALATIFMPNLLDVDSADGRCKNMLPVMEFLIQHIYEIMTIPTPLHDDVVADQSSDSDSPTDSLMRTSPSDCLSRWKCEHLDFLCSPDVSPTISSEDYAGISVFSRLLPASGHRLLREFRAEVELPISIVPLFVRLIENRQWDPSFVAYEHQFSVTAEVDVVKARHRYAPDETLHLSRFTGRLNAARFHSQVFLLYECSTAAPTADSVTPASPTAPTSVRIWKSMFLLRRDGAYKTRVVFFSLVETTSPVEPPTFAEGIRHTADVLRSLREQKWSAGERDACDEMDEELANDESVML